MAGITKSVKIPEDLARQLTERARERRTTESELIREGIAQVIRDREGLDMSRLLAEGIGIGTGPSDLSEGGRHFEGYGRSRHR
jgi:hypothetical protein